MEYILSDIIELIGGGTPKTSIPEYWDGDIPWLSVKDFSGEKRYVYETEKSITEEGLNNSSTKYLNQDDIIVSARGTVGEMAMIPFPMTFNQSCYGIRAKRHLVDPFYLYYLMKYNLGVLKSKVHGSVFDTITKDTFKQITVDLQCLEVQKKVAAILGNLDDKIEINEKINRNLEEQAFVLFDSYFPNAIYGERKIGDFISPSRGKNLVTKDAIPGDVPVVAGGLSPSTYHNESNTTGPVLTISASGANAGYVRLWNQSVWSSDSSYIDSSMTDNVYFWYVMLKKRQKEIFDSQTGSAQPHVYPKNIEMMPVINLDKAAITEYTNEVTPMFYMIGSNNKENISLSELRDSLLPKLISGEMDVSDLDI